MLRETLDHKITQKDSIMNLKMLILLHVGVALSSIAWSTYLFFAPSKAKIYTSYALVALTLGSGTYLVLSTHARILQSCIMGLAYTAVVSVGIVSAHTKLAVAEDE